MWNVVGQLELLFQLSDVCFLLFLSLSAYPFDICAIMLLLCELVCMRKMKSNNISSLSSFHKTSRRILRYGNSFLPTFPEVLLAHASQMTGQLSRSMHIACKYWQAERQYKMRCTRQLRQNLLLHFAEQPRFMAYKPLQLTVEVRSSEGGLCMAAPLQRSGEYDVFLKMSPSALDQRWTWTLVMNLQDRTSARLLTSPFHGGAESRVQIPELRVPMSPQMPHGPLSKHAAPRLRAAFCHV